MRFPNGYGSVYKLSGKRRNPWTARVTTGWTFDAEKQTSYPLYKYLGYFTTRTEALEMLVKYNQDPNDLNYSDITFKEVYKRWSEEHYPTLLNLKNLFLLMYEYAVKHEIVTKDKKDIVSYLDINKTGNPNARAHKTFSKESINILWDNKDNDPYISTILILIFTKVKFTTFTSSPSFSNELNTGSSKRLALMLIIFSLSISLSFRIPRKKIDDRTSLYRLNRLPILIISTNVAGDRFLIFISSSFILIIKKGRFDYLLYLPLDNFI